MRKVGKTALTMVGGALFALTIYLILAVPGLTSDRTSTVPNQPIQGSRR